MTNNNPISFADIPGAPKAGTVLCSLETLAREGAIELVYREGQALFLVFIQWHEGGAVAYENQCPHAGTPLNLYGGKFLDKTATFLQCFTHGAQFDVASGRCVKGPCKGENLRPVAIVVEDGMVQAA